MDPRHYWQGRLGSFKYAIRGIKLLFSREPNAQFHMGAAVIVIIAGFIFHISAGEWCAVVICIGAMFAAEGLNTSIEKLSDHVCHERHPMIALVKDVAAGAVLCMAVAAVTVGLIIFLPKIIALFS